MRYSFALLGSIPCLVLAPHAFAADVVVNPDATRVPISPYVYGANQVDGSSAKFTAYRLGGNRMTGYNWENNLSHAGTDWENSNDTFMCGNLSEAQCAVPGAVLAAFVDSAQTVGAYPLVTLQMAGYVSADDGGTVTEAQVAPSARWREVVFAKGSAFTTTPNPSDDYVYMDELVNFLVTRYGSGGVRGYALDNEPDLWSSTHLRIHPNPVGAAELVTRSVGLATAVKNVDANAEIFGFVSYGYTGFVNLQDAPDWESVQGSYEWYTEYFLAEMAAASEAAGTRLLDVLDLHFYSEAQQGGTRIQEGTTANAGARVQATRSLWDPDYGYSASNPTLGENSWITQWNDPIELLPRVQRQIAALYPNTKLAITEYDFGAAGHVSGGIAQADALGIFGREGVYFATRWGDPGSYTDAAYRLYLDYDGNGASFGDTSVSATTSDVVNVPVYASVESGSAARLHLVIINRNLSAAQTASVTIAGTTRYRSGHAWGFGSGSASITDRGDVAVSSNVFSLEVPALAAYHVVLTPEGATVGTGGTPGTAGAAGATSRGGTTGTAGQAGRTSAGGTSSIAGRTGTGGRSGGSPASGGSRSGGATATGGNPSGGNASGGTASAGSEPGAGGSTIVGPQGGVGRVSGGEPGTTGATSGVTGLPTAGSAGATEATKDEGGCGCRVASPTPRPLWVFGVLAVVLGGLHRRRRHQ